MKIELDLDERGEFIGEVPAELTAILKRTETTAHGVGYGKGVQQAALDAKKQIEDTVALERQRFEAMQPLERERIARIEEDNKTLSGRLADLSKESDRTLKGREEAHARELVARAEQLKLRDARIRQLTTGNIRADALQAGARDESLDELELIIGNYLGFDDDMRPFVKGPDGSPMTAAGKPVPIQAFVKQYLDQHPHHKRVSTGRGGDARRGASLTGAPPTTASMSAEAAKARIEGGDRSLAAVNDLFNAMRQKSA